MYTVAYNNNILGIQHDHGSFQQLIVIRMYSVSPQGLEFFIPICPVTIKKGVYKVIIYYR